MISVGVVVAGKVSCGGDIVEPERVLIGAERRGVPEPVVPAFRRAVDFLIRLHGYRDLPGKGFALRLVVGVVWVQCGRWLLVARWT